LHLIRRCSHCNYRLRFQVRILISIQILHPVILSIPIK
jgi:hypothetical protein